MHAGCVINSRHLLERGVQYKLENVKGAFIRQEKNGKWGTVKSLFRNRPLNLLHLLEGDEVIHYILSSVCPVMDAFVFRPSFKRFHVDGQKRFKLATCGRVF